MKKYLTIAHFFKRQLWNYYRANSVLVEVIIPMSAFTL